NGMYAPPELICIDQTKGSTTAMRAGLERSKSILVSRAASVLLAVNTRRLARLTNQAHSFVQQYVVDQGLRAVMVSQGIDTDDEGIANRIRFGQTGLFLRCGLTS